MKNFKIFSSILMFAAAFAITSCGDTEPLGEIVPDNCSAPNGFQISALIGTNVNLTWQDNGSASEWEVVYGPMGFSPNDGTSIIAEDNNLTITDLTAGVDYEYYVRALCSANETSEWEGPISIENSCATPTALAAIRSETNLTQVLVSWTPGGTSTQWQVEYGFVGYTPGTGTSVLANSTPTKTLTNINQNQDYHIWVRTICGPDERSYWVGPVLVEAINALSVNVDGVAFDATGVDATLTTIEDTNYINISATNEPGDMVTLLVKKTLPVGTYTAAPDVILSYTEEGIEYFADAESPITVTITSKTPHSMVGTFSFTTVDEDGLTMQVITNGSFAVTF